MEILQYNPNLLTPLTQFYNRLTTDVPHCHPIKNEELAQALCGVITGKADKTEGGLDSESAFVIVDNGEILAFILLRCQNPVPLGRGCRHR